MTEQKILLNGTLYSADYKEVFCSEPRCWDTRPNHKGGAIRAQEQGWFQQATGQNWCHRHNPEWVAEWRAKQNGAKK